MNLRQQQAKRGVEMLKGSVKDVLDGFGEPLLTSQISGELQISTEIADSVLLELESQGCVYKDPKTGKWQLG